MGTTVALTEPTDEFLWQMLNEASSMRRRIAELEAIYSRPRRELIAAAKRAAQRKKGKHVPVVTLDEAVFNEMCYTLLVILGGESHRFLFNVFNEIRDGMPIDTTIESIRSSLNLDDPYQKKLAGLTISAARHIYRVRDEEARKHGSVPWSKD